MKRFILCLTIILLFCGNALGAALTQYIDTDVSGGNADGSSWANAYASMASWAAQNLNLTDNGGDTLTVYCRGESADTTGVTFTGWTTSATYYITMIGDNDTGQWSTSHYRLAPASGTVMHINNWNFHAVFNNIQIGATGAHGIYIENVSTSDIEFNYCIITKLGTNMAWAMGLVNYSSGTIKIASSIISGWSGENEYNFSNNDADSTVSLCNVIITDGNTGANNDAGTVSIINSAIFNNVNDINGTIGVTYSAGDDAEFDSGTGNIGWDNTATDWNANFTDYSTGDFSIKDTNADIYNAGTTPGTSKDIIGYSWVTNDIGAFAYQVTQGLLLIW